MSHPYLLSRSLLPDAWLSDVLKKPCYRLSMDDAEMGDNFRSTLKDSGNIFVYAKVPPEDLKHIHFLETLGFGLIETSLLFERGLAGEIDVAKNPALTITNATTKDATAVENIAKEAFRVSRFHLDPQIGFETACRLKKEWVGNFFKKQRGDALLVAKRDEQVIGFLLLLFAPAKRLIIDLIATDPAFQGQGVAKALIEFAREQYATKFTTIAAGTQAVNKASISLYQQTGFKLCSCTHIYHYHKPATETHHEN